VFLLKDRLQPATTNCRELVPLCHLYIKLSRRHPGRRIRHFNKGVSKFTLFVCFLPGNSPVSKFYMPTFRNTLFHLHRQVGVRMTRFETQGRSLHVSRYPPQPVPVLGIAPTLSPSFLMAQAILSQTFSRMNIPTYLKHSHSHTYLPMKMEQCSETSAHKIQTPGNCPEEIIQHSEHGETLKSRNIHTSFPCTKETLKTPVLCHRFIVPKDLLAWTTKYLVHASLVRVDVLQRVEVTDLES